MNKPSTGMRSHPLLFMLLLLVDLDNTVRRAKEGEFAGFKNQEIIPEMGQTLSRFKEAGFRIAAISNQGGIESGYKTLKSTIMEMRELLFLCPSIDRVYFCPTYSAPHTVAWEVRRPWWMPLRSVQHIDTEYADYRKPGTGMIGQACAQYEESALAFVFDGEEKSPPLDMRGYFPICYEPVYPILVGDMDSDSYAAQQAKIPFLWPQDLIESHPGENFWQLIRLEPINEALIQNRGNNSKSDSIAA